MSTDRQGQPRPQPVRPSPTQTCGQAVGEAKSRAGRVGRGGVSSWLPHRHPSLPLAPHGTKQGFHLEPLVRRDAQAGLGERVVQDLWDECDTGSPWDSPNREPMLDRFRTTGNVAGVPLRNSGVICANQIPLPRMLSLLLTSTLPKP